MISRQRYIHLKIGKRMKELRLDRLVHPTEGGQPPPRPPHGGGPPHIAPPLFIPQLQDGMFKAYDAGSMKGCLYQNTNVWLKMAVHFGFTPHMSAIIQWRGIDGDEVNSDGLIMERTRMRYNHFNVIKKTIRIGGLFFQSFNPKNNQENRK